MRAQAIALFVVGIILLTFGFIEYAQEAGSTEPAVITSAELLAQGAPGNPYVRITDADPDLHKVATLKAKKFGETLSDTAYVPLVSRSARAGDAPKLVAILEVNSNELTGFDMMFAFSESHSKPVQGLRLESIFGHLNGEVSDYLVSAYGKEAVSRAPCIEYNREPLGPRIAYTLMLASAFACIGGGVLLFKARRGAAPHGT